jgi:hypothetical protein
MALLSQQPYNSREVCVPLRNCCAGSTWIEGASKYEGAARIFLLLHYDVFGREGECGRPAHLCAYVDTTRPPIESSAKGCSVTGRDVRLTRWPALPAGVAAGRRPGSGAATGRRPGSALPGPAHRTDATGRPRTSRAQPLGRRRGARHGPPADYRYAGVQGWGAAGPGAGASQGAWEVDVRHRADTSGTKDDVTRCADKAYVRNPWKRREAGAYSRGPVLGTGLTRVGRGAEGAHTCAPRPAPPSEICAPRPAPPCAPASPGHGPAGPQVSEANSLF